MRRRAWVPIVLAGLVSSCGSQTGDQERTAAGAAPTSADPATSGAASGVPPSPASAASTAAEAAPPPKPLPDPESIAQKAEAACPKKLQKEAGPLSIFVGPQDPVEGAPLRAMIVPSGTERLGEVPGDGVVVIDPEKHAAHAPTEARLGPPASLFAYVNEARAGTYRLVVHKDGEVVACSEVAVTRDRKRRPGGSQAVAWEVTRAWDPALENLYSAWIEKLFSAKPGEPFSFTSLHEITKDTARNFLHDHLGLDEDDPPPRGIRLDPDCADLPYFLRAYFSFKMGLPFAYSGCSRGGGGRPPVCQESQSNLDPLDAPVASRIRRFETFARGPLKNTVHSGTGRALATENKGDYYPIHLSRETLRPGAIYADPYGHVLVVAQLVPQPGNGAGLLFAVDGQPDGTVSRKRFWRGNFLFSQSDAAMGSPGFKRFRPAVRKSGRIVELGNEAIERSASYGDFSLEQMNASDDGFYDMMDDVLSPRPLDPHRALLATIDALEEQVKARVTSVENGEKHFRSGGGAIDMPNGASIFETTGDWEDFSTPARDLRVLIATDVVKGFPALVARRPERFEMPTGKRKDDVVKELERELDAAVHARSIEYVRSDGSKFKLTLADVLARTEALEMAYNPNDCAEARWGAPEGSAERSTCKRHASADQRRKMQKVRGWFHDRKRPARG